jgi:SAM-dependent methyltransferase
MPRSLDDFWGGLMLRITPQNFAAWLYDNCVGRPWSWNYGAFRAREIKRILNNLPVSLPQQPFGAWIDERIVEYPWMLKQLGSAKGGGQLLDAGAGLNVSQPLSILKQQGWTVSSITLERERFSVPGVKYYEGDLRCLPFKDCSFDAVCCLSTLEHVGMDNAKYANGKAGQPTDRSDWLLAVKEMWRVTSVGGVLRITVPCGEAADHGWFQVFPPQLGLMIRDALRGAEVRCQYFIHQASGWIETDARTVEQCLCWDPASTERYVTPRAAFSEGIICIEVVHSSERVDS